MHIRCTYCGNFVHVLKYKPKGTSCMNAATSRTFCEGDIGYEV